MPSPNSLHLREANEDDLPAIVAMLADDILGKTRESASEALPQVYKEAFSQIDSDPYASVQLLTDGTDILGCAQINILANLSLTGTKRGQIEGVRIAADHRGRGLGSVMLDLLEKHLRGLGCGLMQFTTNRQRNEALSFYEQRGFEPSHIGFKKAL